MVYEIDREVIKVATKKEMGLVMIKYIDTETKEEFEDFFDTENANLTMQFIPSEQTESTGYTIGEYNEFHKHVKEIKEGVVKVDYDRENKSAYISSAKITRLCNQYNAWDTPDGDKRKNFNVDIKVKNNELLQKVYIYNSKNKNGDYIEMEMDLSIDETAYEILLQEVEMIVDTTNYGLDPYTFKRIPKDKRIRNTKFLN